MRTVTVALLVLPALASASPFVARANSAASNARHPGSTTSDQYPPSGTSVDTAVFPDASRVGFPGPTLTGIEPFAIATAPAQFRPKVAEQYPLFKPTVLNESASDEGTFDLTRYWGNLSPFYSVDSSVYGLDSASATLPSNCTIDQVHLVLRHGARYPTSGSAPAAFAAKLNNATVNGTGFQATGDLAFLNRWEYGLGAELLTPFGRLQNFEAGVAFRTMYGHLLNNFTRAGTLPVFRTESQNRMVKTALNFMAGMFGVPEYQEQASLEIMIEQSGYNNTFAPYYTCNNSNVNAIGNLGSAIAANWSNIYFQDTTKRINSQLSGITLKPSDIVAMLQLCAYETDALGYSSFCPLFTESDFAGFEYQYDLSFYYSEGQGSAVGAAQGKAYLQELVSRLTHMQLTAANATSALNITLDGNPTTFPLNQSIFADFTHEVTLLDILTAFNLTALAGDEPLPYADGTIPSTKSRFVASRVVPFATRFVVQVLSPTAQLRIILNDAVLPLKGIGECGSDPNGLCALDTVIDGFKRRLEEIDFDYACYGNYTLNPSKPRVRNGLAPRSSET